MKNIIASFLAGLSLVLSATAAQAASGGTALQAAGTNVSNAASLQRGAKLYMNYCVSCHSLQYLRYSRIGEDLGLTEEQVMQNLNFTGAKYGETVDVAMSTADGEQWFGKAPPDLSLVARSRGVDWVYTYLKSFYLDESTPSGWNNTVLPNAAMPNVLWELQGVQHAVTEKGEHGETMVKHFEVATPGLMNEREYDEAVRDITTFLEYAGEPASLQREKYGVWVILFLAVLTFLLYLLKVEYWRDVH